METSYPKIQSSRRLMAALIAVVSLASTSSFAAEAATSGVDWPQYRGDLSGTGYSSLTQISAANVSELEQGWRYSLLNESSTSTRGPNSQATPIVVDGVMYLPAANRVVALDPTSGTEIWRYVLDEGTPSRRGVSYWPGNGSESARIFFTAFDRLIALDANTGALVSSFGQAGEVSLGIPYNSVPLVYKNVIVVGANTPRGAAGGIGNARAFNANTGEKLWEFDSVPPPGSFGHDTWEGDSWIGRLGANAWPFYFTVDQVTDLLFLPLASPIPFAFGGDRAGANLFANSLVAVDISTGEYAWHFQTIHHDLWDHDPPAPPTLFDIPTDEGVVPALGVTTKSGYLYILNRNTGEPIYGVEERAVTQSEVPGEETFPTQPFPLKPPPLARVSYDADDLVTAADTSVEHANACAELVAGVGELYNVGPFTPWVYRAPNRPERTTLLFPGLAGGPNWGGAAFNPNSGTIYVFSADSGSMGWMEAAEEGSEFPFQMRGPRPGGFEVRVDGVRMPCQKPPWGTLSAIDTRTGDMLWQRAVGVTESLPAAKQNTGRPGRAGALVTATNLVFIAATDDNRFRAIDGTSGRELWSSTMEQRGNASPMSYQGNDGNQYVVITATDSVIAYRLPSSSR